MSASKQKYFRMFQVLSWIQALNQGFEQRFDQELATLSNLAAHMLREEAMADRYEDAADEFEFLKRHLNGLLHKYRVNGFVRRPGKVAQTSENHIALRRGRVTQGNTVYWYELTGSGEAFLEWCEERFKNQNTFAAENGVDASQSVKIPEEQRFGWDLVEEQLHVFNLDYEFLLESD